MILGRREENKKKLSTTCCKNTVNSAAECAEGVGWVIRQTADCTADLLVIFVFKERHCWTWGAVPGSESRRPLQSIRGRSLLITEYCTESPLSPPGRLLSLPLWKLFVQGWRLAQHCQQEKCVYWGGGHKVLHASHSDNLRLNCLLSDPASFLAALHNK